MPSFRHFFHQVAIPTSIAYMLAGTHGVLAEDHYIVTLHIPDSVSDPDLRKDIADTFKFYAREIPGNAKQIADDPAAKLFRTKKWIADNLYENKRDYVEAGRWYQLIADEMVDEIKEAQEKKAQGEKENNQKVVSWQNYVVQTLTTIRQESLAKVQPINEANKGASIPRSGRVE